MSFIPRDTQSRVPQYTTLPDPVRKVWRVVQVDEEFQHDEEDLRMFAALEDGRLFPTPRLPIPVTIEVFDKEGTVTVMWLVFRNNGPDDEPLIFRDPAHLQTWWNHWGQPRYTVEKVVSTCQQVEMKKLAP